MPSPPACQSERLLPMAPAALTPACLHKSILGTAASSAYKTHCCICACEPSSWSDGLRLLGTERPEAVLSLVAMRLHKGSAWGLTCARCHGCLKIFRHEPHVLVAVDRVGVLRILPFLLQSPNPQHHNHTAGSSMAELGQHDV